MTAADEADAPLGPRLLSTPEVAAYLNVTDDVVWDRVQSGELTAVRLSQRMLKFRVEDVQAYVASRLTEPRTPMVRDGLKVPRAKSPGGRARRGLREAS